MIGNLKIFFGEEALDTYAHWLRLIGEPALPGEGMLWIVRTVLLVSVVAHVVAATILARRARAARPVKYAHRRPVTTSYASRTMRWGGVIILLFVIYHILDLTTGTLNPNGVPGEVYDNVVADFSRWYITLAYTVAMIAARFPCAARRVERPAVPGPLERPEPEALQGDRAGVRGGLDGGLPGRALRRAVRIGRCFVTGYADYTVGPPVEDDAAPGGSIDTRWERHRFGVKLVNPANKRKMKVIVVGTGLAGGSAAATLGELGYQVSSFCFQDSPRRAHSIAAQGGINAAKNYRNDGDSVFRLFYDTIKGGDFRARESNVHRLAEISRQIIDQCVAQGVPFAREYGGLLDTRSFGGAQVSRTFYARGQTGQQLLLGAYQALERQIRAGTVTMYNRHEMLELIVVDGRARGIVARDLVTGREPQPRGRRRGARLGWLRQRVLPVDQRQGLQRHGELAGAPQGRAVRESLLHPDPSHLYPGQWRAPVEADADERVAAQRRPGVGAQGDAATTASPRTSPRSSATTSWSASTRRSATWSRVTSPAAPRRPCATPSVASVRRVWGSTSTSPTRSTGWAGRPWRRKYGNLFDMYERITGENPYEVPMRIYPAVHYTMGGLWVDYDLQSHDPGAVRGR